MNCACQVIQTYTPVLQVIQTFTPFFHLSLYIQLWRRPIQLTQTSLFRSFIHLRLTGSTISGANSIHHLSDFFNCRSCGVNHFRKRHSSEPNGILRYDVGFVYRPRIFPHIFNLVPVVVLTIIEVVLGIDSQNERFGIISPRFR